MVPDVSLDQPGWLDTKVTINLVDAVFGMTMIAV
jgi:hypothetical protein